MSNTNSTATTKKNAVNAPQIIESKNPSNHPTRATSLAREGAPAIYRVVLRRLIDANDEERREHWEMCRDFERNGESVPDEREKIGQLLYRQYRLLEALKECHPDALYYLLVALHTPLTEKETALFEFLSVLWSQEEDNQ